MRGLAMTSPTFGSMKIRGRCARKHYGCSIFEDFSEGVHDENRR